MTYFPSLAPSSRAAQTARGLVSLIVAFLVHFLIWVSSPPMFALALSAALVLIERLVAILADIVLGAIAASDPVLTSHVKVANSVSFWHELKTELTGAAGTIGVAIGAAVAGVHVKQWAEPMLVWLGP